MYSPAKNKVSTFIRVTKESNTRSKHLIHIHDASSKYFSLQPLLLQFPAIVTTMGTQPFDYVKSILSLFTSSDSISMYNVSSIQV